MEEHAVQQNLTDQHLSRMIPSGWVGSGTRQEMQRWPHHSGPKTHLQHIHPWVARDRLLHYS